MKKHTRREFLERAIFGAGAGVALTAFAPGSLGAGSQITREGRAFAAGKYGIELDGIMAGWVMSAEGGHATSDVVSEKTGPSQKHLAGVKYEDITVNCGAGMSRAFYEWIKSTFDRQHVRKNGAISVYDFNYKELERREFTNALITEIGFPALDAASKDAAKLTIKITPEYTRTQSAGRPMGAPSPRAQKQWLPANFRLTIAGLDCRRVNKIEAITVKQKVVENPTGELRSYQKEPAHLEVPNLVVTLPEADAAAWETWRKGLTISGKTVTGVQKTGQLEYLTPDMRETLFTLSFHNLGIFKLTPEKVEAGGENIRRVKAEMYCEDIKFTYGNSTWA